ncbi:hypothetical protein AMK05_CH00778 [Rhizobium sp. N324]|nr:hypothetical protein AMK05_CH00778 [Rhizobium sp. N324]OYD02775.1 hypothetical protein AMK08_CH100774 [Rhizobium sp. N4311]
MSIIPDISDAGIAAQFGDIVHELPELYEALRRFEIENRPAVTSGGFKTKADCLSVQRGRNMFRIKVGNARSKE